LTDEKYQARSRSVYDGRYCRNLYDRFWYPLDGDSGTSQRYIALFGVLWTGIAVVTTVYNFRNATGKNRYSQFDITEGDEEPDPLNERFGESREPEKAGEESDSRFCPYCGTPVHENFSYCNSCGKKLP